MRPLLYKKSEKNVVIISEERYNRWRRLSRMQPIWSKLERGLEQVHAGLGITKTMEELEAMAEDGT